MWEKRGFIYKPNSEAPWMKTHAQVPTALVLDDRIRVYITVRPEQTITMMTYVDVDIKNPSKILYVHKEPIIPLGGPGMFDEFGVMSNWAMHVGSEVWLYYNGWNRGHTIPLYNAIGLAISKDNGATFEKPFPGPVINANRNEPYSTLAPAILREGNVWRMWYGATMEWKKHGEKYEQVYTIFYAHSKNGLDWERPHISCIPSSYPGECTVRPTVLFENGLYHMWFCCRGNSDYRGGKGSYRIGYASSKDGLSWQRDDSKAGIEPSDSGWDAVMIANPSIADTPHGRYLFYDGNNFGVDGFGYAVWRGAR